MGFAQWPSSASSAIKTYIQSASPILTSGSIAIPKGTKRVEALMCGGGGGGSGVQTAIWYGGGGPGGIAVYEIPIIGSTIDYIVGAGGLAANTQVGNDGGATVVSISDEILAVVGGGASAYNRNAKYGGGGSGVYPYYESGAFHPARVVSSPFDLSRTQTSMAGYFNTPSLSTVHFNHPGNSFGYGASGQGVDTTGDPGFAGGGGGGGNGGNGVTPGGGAGGSLTAYSIWGITGKAGGAGGPANSAANFCGGGGGGGGWLSAGTAGVGGTTGKGGDGGLGGGGGGSGSFNSWFGKYGAGGKGGDGFIMFRFYK